MESEAEAEDGDGSASEEGSGGVEDAAAAAAAAEAPEEESGAEASPEKKDRAAGYRAMLEAERAAARRQRRAKRLGIFEMEAEEESEDETAKGLGDFGFGVSSNKEKDADEEHERGADVITEEDLKGIVDTVSDDEGDDEAVEARRKAEMEKRDVKETMEVMRRLRDGYADARSGRMNVRGNLRFDQLTADTKTWREEMKRLGLSTGDGDDSDMDEDEKKMREMSEEELAQLLVDGIRRRNNAGKKTQFFEDLELSDSDDDEDGGLARAAQEGELDPEALAEAREQAEERRWRRRAKMRRALSRMEELKRQRSLARGADPNRVLLDGDEESQQILNLLELTNSNGASLAKAPKKANYLGILDAEQLKHGGGMGFAVIGAAGKKAQKAAGAEASEPAPKPLGDHNGSKRRRAAPIVQGVRPFQRNGKRAKFTRKGSFIDRPGLTRQASAGGAGGSTASLRSKFAFMQDDNANTGFGESRPPLHRSSSMSSIGGDNNSRSASLSSSLWQNVIGRNRIKDQTS